MTPVRLLLVLFLWQWPDGAVTATPHGRCARPILPTAPKSGCPRDISAEQKPVRLEPVALCISRSVPKWLRILKTIARLPNLAAG
jgi:hypothetical protein